MRFKQGDVIGDRFEVVKMLGEGGAGIVYLVRDKTRETEVALKVIRPEIAKNKLALERFMREVEVMRKIHHTCIVKVYDTGRIGDMLFYTMEYAKGHSISRIVRKKGPMEIGRAIRMMRGICDAIEQVHAVAIHRDISSDNIIVQSDDSVRILDFGTARIAGEDSSLTRTNIHIGKIYYSAPEQRANSKAVDHRADLYSLAVLFYEMLTGEIIMFYEPATTHRPDLSPEFDTFFNKGLAEKPEDRYQTAAELRAAIQELAGFDSH